MKQVKVEKDRLIGIITGNRDNHRRVFEDAMEGFTRQALNELDALVERVKAGKPPRNLLVPLPVPQDHTRDYDRALKMLEMEVGETVVLTDDEFAHLVQDDWRWKREFVGTVSNYSSMAQPDEFDL